MQAYEVDVSRWAYKLAPLLTGKAQQAYAALDLEDAKSYAAVKAAVLRRYNINEETYRKRFRGLTLKMGETPVEMMTHLNDLAIKWLKDDMSAVEIRDAVVKEQLLAALPQDVAVYTVSDCVTNFAHAQLSCFYLLSTQNATKWRSRPRPSPGLKLHGVKGQRNIFAHAPGGAWGRG